jgi:phosphoglycolate phosphatase
MSNSYQLVVFDWEGTISDTLGLILHTVAAEAKVMGFGEIDPYEARKYVDLGLVQALRKTFPHLSAQQHDQLLQAVHHAMISRPSEVCLIPGARELIQRIYDGKISMAIATNKGQYSLHRALQVTSLDSFFKVTRSAGQTPAKPCPQMLEEIMDEIGVVSSATLMVGDSITDIEMAKKINVDAVGVDFYQQQKDALRAAGALAIFDDYKLLADFLKLPKV